jgi:excinuclease ABC subunit B
MEYNTKHNITPTQIVKATREIIGYEYRKDKAAEKESKAYIAPERSDIAADPVVKYMTPAALEKAIANTKKGMEKASKELDFIEAARLRDEMYRLQELLKK